MAIYRLESRILGRNQGHTSVGYAAYLAAEKLYDERYDEERNYAKKRLQQRLFHSEIVTPEHAPEWTRNRHELWNRNEAAEKRKDAQVGREIIVALPTELSHEQKVKLGLHFIRQEYVAKGMVADVNFHNFKGEDSHNPHMQVLLTTRRIEGEGFAKKKEEAWRPTFVKDPKTGRTIVDPEFLKAERKVWERYCNRALEQAGHDQRVDCRSLKDQGIDRLPQPKLGKAHSMEQRAEWAGRTDAGDAWRETQDINLLKTALEKAGQEHQAIFQEARTELNRFAYELGQDLAREEQAHKQPKVEPPPPPAARERKREPLGLEPWKRDWEKAQEQRRQQRAAREKQQERKAAIARKEAARDTQRQASKPPAPSQDDRRLIDQWQQFFERERGKPRASGQQSDQTAGSAPGQISPEQQVAKLREEMAAFGAEDERRDSGHRSDADAARMKTEQQRLEEERQREAERQRQQHPRGFGR